MEHIYDNKQQLSKNKNLIGIWKFDNLTIKDMKDLTRDTKYSGIEHGGLLCGEFESRKIKLQKQCTGTSCKISIHDKKCEGDVWLIGSFHTHPNGKKHELSHRDILNFNNREHIGCLGLPNSKTKKDNVLCHTNKSNNDNYWNEKNKEKSKLNEMIELENDVHKNCTGLLTIDKVIECRKKVKF